MALELTYRERLHKVYREVKNRLDYHISVQNMMRRKEQEHMINWVEKHVVQSISAQQVCGVQKLLELYWFLLMGPCCCCLRIGVAVKESLA